MANAFQQVVTYQKSGLAFLQNAFCYINKSNKKYREFNKIDANLGDTVSFTKPYRFRTQPNLNITVFGNTEQRFETLTVTQQQAVSYEFTNQEFIFNAEKFMEMYGKGAVMELGSKIEADVATVNIDNTYRFFGDGVTPINSYTQLATALSFFRDYGAAQNDTRGILPMINIPAIIGTGLNQFAPDRNNKIANSWELGEFARCEWYQSNLLPIHVAGTVGETGATLTLVSTNDPTGANVTQLTFSGAALSDPNAVKAGDLFQFQDGVAGQPNMRYLTFIGHAPSANPVQFRATANAASDGAGNVIVTVAPALVWLGTSLNQNLNNPLAAGMQVKALPSHRAGLIYSGDALYLAMPRLPDEVPFPTSSEVDALSGATMRMYFGSKFAENQRGFVHDVIYGYKLVDEYAMRMVFPV